MSRNRPWPAGFLLLLLCGVGHAAAPAEHDGAHDFDFNFGVWKTHIIRKAQPLTDSKETVELDGTVTTRKVWGGRAWLEEIEADGPNGHWQGLSLFLYNPSSRQWSQNFFNGAHPEVSSPLIGSFKDGRGELFSQDTVDGRSILVRGVWSDITKDAHKYEESYSNDGGTTWEVAFTGNLTRLSDATAGAGTESPTVAHDGSHDFDFDHGTWKTHTSRLQKPLTGSKTWAPIDGMTHVSKVWGGRANLAEYKAEGPGGQVELLALRLYAPASKQWSIHFATPGSGALGIPGIGEFRKGRVEFYDQEPINGKSVLVRFSMWGITPDTARSEQAFSVDGGRTWETNWVNEYTRARSVGPSR